MKIKIEYKTDPAKELVDLTDFGFTTETHWGDLPPSEQDMITESCRDCVIVQIKDVSLVKEK